jgi:hypothetical protein
MKRPFGFMETDLSKQIITEIARYGLCEKVTFHVMGEPTVHPDFFEILQYAQNEKVNVGLTTNGAGLGGETGKRLLDYDLYQVDISLQTPDEKSFSLRRAGALTFDDYMKGILGFFSSYYSAKGGRTNFKFRFLNTRFRNKEMEKRTGPVRVISSTKQLRSTFRYWAKMIYDIIGVDEEKRKKALIQIDRLQSYRWNVVEIYPQVFFETYMLYDWGHAFADERIHDAWAGYCFGMRDHFSVLYNGDVVLCCMDFDGHTAIGNLHNASLRQVLSSEELGIIIDGFKKYRVVHPYCKRCLGSRTVASWLAKPVASIVALKVLKSFFHKHTRVYN